MKVRKFLYKCSLTVLFFWVLEMLPTPTEHIPLRLKNGIVGIVAVLYIGKLLYDTLFYDRYA
jgi:hypothetical protein